MHRLLYVFCLFSLGTMAASLKEGIPVILTERFGISHPQQIVYFELPLKITEEQKRSLALLDEKGAQVPFQIMADGRLAINTDLPKDATRKWTLKTSKPKPFTSVFTSRKHKNTIEIGSDLLGIRIPNSKRYFKKTPAPIQDFRFRDGVWTQNLNPFMHRQAKKFSVEQLEDGPLIVKYRIRYEYEKKAVHSYRVKRKDGKKGPGLVIPAGQGYYQTTIELQAGQPSILFEEESTVNTSYSIDFYEEMKPTQARYRGHHADSLKLGRNAKGTLYKTGGENGSYVGDALVDLEYPLKSFTGPWRQIYGPVSLWDPWARNTGWYWMFYSNNKEDDKLLGVFSGPASRLLQPTVSGVYLGTYADKKLKGRKKAEIWVWLARLGPDQRWSEKIRFSWGLFLGKKSVDLKDQMAIQPINLQMNQHAGINLNKLKDIDGDYPDPSGGYGSMYVANEDLKRLQDRLSEEAANGKRDLYSAILNTGVSKQLLDYLKDPSAAKSAELADKIIVYADDYLNALVHGEGIYRSSSCYFMGALRMNSWLPVINLLLGNKDLPRGYKTKLKMLLHVVGDILWDDDVAPMQNKAGVNWGPENMRKMWLGTRYNYTPLLEGVKDYKPRVEALKNDAVAVFKETVQENGAQSACPHYMTASIVPLLNLFQQLQKSAVYDVFKSEKRMRHYAEFVEQLVTPPEPRFGGHRKIISVGDGSTEANVLVGQLATGYRNADPKLSKELMGIWKAMGSPHNNFMGSSFLKIVTDLPSVFPTLKSKSFKGYMSVLRSAWNSPDETAVFFLNGDFLSDHRHNDQGNIILYALGAPLSIDWGPVYYPRVDGGLMHSIVIPENHIKKGAWTSNNLPVNEPLGNYDYNTWWYTEQEWFCSFRNSSASGAAFKLLERAKTETFWHRDVYLIHPVSYLPVIIIKDRFTGKKAAGRPMIATFNMMARGAVMTPAGSVTPEKRFYRYRDKALHQNPSANDATALTAGLNKFHFSGQWTVDWDLYMLSNKPMAVSLGNWGHDWCPSLEQREFRNAHKRPFEETQHIIRFRGTDQFQTIILPYRKEPDAKPWEISQKDGTLLLTHDKGTIILADNFYSFADDTKKVLTSFTEKAIDAFGLSVSGGPAEVVLERNIGTVTFSGKAGSRSVQLPEDWAFSDSQQKAGKNNTYRIDFPGEAQQVLHLLKKKTGSQ